MSVIALDSLVEGHRPAVPPDAIFCQVDLADRAQLDAVFSRHKIDAVMHFAAEALVAKSVREPSIFYATNVASVVNLLCRHPPRREKIHLFFDCRHLRRTRNRSYP